MPSITRLRQLHSITSLSDRITWVGEARDRSIRITVGPLRVHSMSYTQRKGTKLSEREVERLVKDAQRCAATVAGLAVSHLTVAYMWKR